VTVGSATVALLGLLLGWRGPRAPRLVLGLASFAIALVLCLAMVVTSHQSILLASVWLALIAAAAVLVPARASRLFLVLWGGIALVGIVQPLMWQPAKVPVIVMGMLVVAVTAWRRPRRLLAVLCALLGGWLVVQGLDVAPGWVVFAAAVLFGLQERHRRRWQEPRSLPARGEVVAFGSLAAAALTATAVLLLPFLVEELPPPRASVGPPGLAPLPFEARRSRIREAAPRGGFVWPLPSETLTWGADADPALYPRLETLDARYLGAEVRGLRRLPGTDLDGAFTLHPVIASLRRIPDVPALQRLRAAARATVAALAEVAPRARDDLPEAELARLLEEAMKRRGCERGAFPPIVASGSSVGTGHGSGNRGRLVNGTLVVIDIGCRVDGYVSDFTRTLPVGGRFAPVFRPSYDGVLAAQRAAERACRPGVSLGPRLAGRGESLDAIAREVLVRKLGRDRMGHALGHTVGLFVHDVPSVGPLESGMVITLEPGAYGAAAGLRIEDTYLVTENACERLTEGFPADAERVEEAMEVPGRPR
jgi:Xaa-Pro aminopeptidase